MRLRGPRLGVAASAGRVAPMQSRTGGDLVYRSPSGDYFGSLLVGSRRANLTVDLALGGGLHRFMFVPQGAAETRPRSCPT
jgi:hypothetical protein